MASESSRNIGILSGNHRNGLPDWTISPIDLTIGQLGSMHDRESPKVLPDVYNTEPLVVLPFPVSSTIGSSSRHKRSSKKIP